eukprot:410078-Pelagomonas_calceolata.AAC.1
MDGWMDGKHVQLPKFVRSQCKGVKSQCELLLCELLMYLGIGCAHLLCSSTRNLQSRARPAGNLEGVLEPRRTQASGC